MSFKDLAEQVNRCAEDPNIWQQVRAEIIRRHENASAVDEYITLLTLHKMLMDRVEENYSDRIDKEKVRAMQQQDYNSLITRECTIGGSICVDTLYEITQRELEAGRMDPAHKLINLAVDASAEPHYSREQLLRQEEKIKNIERNSSIGKKLSGLFGSIKAKN